MIRKHKKKAIGKTELKRLMKNVALRHSLKALSDEKFKAMWDMDDIIITSSYTGIMWISRNFLAYGDDNVFRYVYISKSHIHEERSSYRRTSLLRLQKVSLPQDIKKAFDFAERHMRCQNTRYWVDDCYLSQNNIMEVGKGL